MKPFKVAVALPADLQRAYDYFKAGGQQSAERFLSHYEEALRHVLDHPETCRLRPSGWRQRTISRSSYSFYRETESFWLIAGVISTVRDPDVIQAQLLIREIREPDETRD